MSSHREAPSISQDPVADNADTYAFVSPDDPTTVTIITNYVPLEGPAGGPNFFEFGDDVLYQINIDNDNDGKAEIVYEFSFATTNADPGTFLYNTGPIDSLDSDNWSRKQFYSITQVTDWGQTGAKRKVLGSNLPSPPCNVGVRSTPNYADLATAAINPLGGGRKVFAGQRKEGFYVDLGSIFDLGALRPFQNLHLIPLAAAPGVQRDRTVIVAPIRRARNEVVRPIQNRADDVRVHRNAQEVPLIGPYPRRRGHQLGQRRRQRHGPAAAARADHRKTAAPWSGVGVRWWCHSQKRRGRTQRIPLGDAAFTI